jgi:hypothetical protein
MAGTSRSTLLYHSPFSIINYQLPSLSNQVALNRDAKIAEHQFIALNRHQLCGAWVAVQHQASSGGLDISVAILKREVKPWDLFKAHFLGGQKKDSVSIQAALTNNLKQRALLYKLKVCVLT